MPAAAAAPERSVTGIIKTTPFFDPLRGSGVQLTPGTRGRAVLYLPVTLPNSAVVRSMRMRIAGVAAGFVKADLYEESSAGPPLRIGHLAAIDKDTTGAFIVTGPVPDRVINNAKNTYSIRVEICSDSVSAAAATTLNPTVYSLGLSPERCNCPPPPPWPWNPVAERACKIQQ